MRYKAVKKEETRRKMLEAVGRGFRSQGYAGIGVDGLARKAGVTSGAFYSHFGSKDKAFGVAVAAGLDEVIESLPDFQREHGRKWVEAFCDYYLGRQHRADLECGCAMAALTPEVIRFGPELHAIFEERMNRIVDRIVGGLKGGTSEARRARAWSFLGTLIGGLNLARAMNSEALSDEVAEAIKSAARDAAGPTLRVSGQRD